MEAVNIIGWAILGVVGFAALIVTTLVVAAVVIAIKRAGRD